MRVWPALAVFSLAIACRGDAADAKMPDCGGGQVLVEATNGTSVARQTYVRFGADSAVMLGVVPANGKQEFVLEPGATGAFVFAISEDSVARAAGKTPIAFRYRCL